MTSSWSATRPWPNDTLRMSRVAAIANTPSLNASRRAVRTASIQTQGSAAASVKHQIAGCEYHLEGLGLLLLQPPHLRLLQRPKLQPTRRAPSLIARPAPVGSAD